MSVFSGRNKHKNTMAAFCGNVYILNLASVQDLYSHTHMITTYTSFPGEGSPCSLPMTLWEQRPPGPRVPANHIAAACQQAPSQNTHSGKTRKTQFLICFSSKLNVFLFRINYFWIKSAKVLQWLQRVWGKQQNYLIQDSFWDMPTKVYLDDSTVP